MFNSVDVVCLIIGFLFGALIGAIIAVGVTAPLDKFCPECGARYHVTAEYCANDGYELREVKN